MISDPPANTFNPSEFEASRLVLPFTTAATVGYGDLVPTTPASKIFAVFVVLLGYAVLSLVTAAMWVENRVESSERRMERDILRDLHAELAELRREIAELRNPSQN
jgi:voltage-gated potassium channel